MPKRLLVIPLAFLLAACATAAPTPTPTASPTAPPLPTPTATPAPTPTTSPSPSATLAATASPTASASAVPTATATQPPIATPTTAPRGWVQVPFFEGSDPATQMNGITFGEGLFVGVGVATHGGTKAATWLSRNGLTWIERGQANFPDAFTAVTYNGTDFFAFGSAPTTVWKSADGSHWDEVQLPVGGGELGGGTVFEGSSIVDATSAGGLIYAAGAAGVVGGDIVCECAGVWRSANGTDWEQSTVTPPDAFNSFAVLAGPPPVILGLGNGPYFGQAATINHDFDEWGDPDVTPDEGTGLLDATSDGHRIVAVGYAGDAYDEALALVTDGSDMGTTKWRFDSSTGAPAEQVAWAGGQFVAVGTGGGKIVSWSSSDGASWTRGPDVGTALSRDLGELGGDDPFNHRAIGGGEPGFVLAQTGDDGLHVWFAPTETFTGGL